MTEKRGFYFFTGQEEEWTLPDLKSLSMSQLLDQLEDSDFKCLAGSIRLNIAFIELRRRAQILDESQHDRLED